MNEILDYINTQETKTVGINEIAAELNIKKRDVIEELREYLQKIIRKNPEGLTITDLTQMMKINRNWIAKQLDLLFLSGKVQRKRIGPAKVYSLSEDGLTKWEKYYLALLENSSDLIMVLTDGPENKLEVDFVSQAVIRILGYSPKDIEDLGLFSIIHPEERSRLYNYSELFEDGKSEHTIYLRCKAKDEKWHHLEVIITDLTSDKNVNGLVLNCRDITETIQLQEKIQFRAVFEKFLLGLSTKFIDIPYDKIDQTIANALGSIGKFFVQNSLANYTVSPGQISMFLFSPGHEQLICSHQWISQVGSTVLTSTIWPEKDFVPLISYFKHDDLVYTSSLENLHESFKHTIKALFSEKIQAYILIPLFDQVDHPLGFIIFQFFKKRDKWTEDAIEMLQIIGTILQSALRNLSRNIDLDLFAYFINRRKKK